MSAFVEDPTAVALIALVAEREVSDWTDAEDLLAQPRYNQITLMIDPVVWSGAHLRSSAAPDADAYHEADHWDDDELHTWPPPGWPPRVQVRADPALTLRLLPLRGRPALMAVRGTSPEQRRRHADLTVGEPSRPTPAPIDLPPAVFEALVAGWAQILRAELHDRPDRAPAIDCTPRLTGRASDDDVLRRFRRSESRSTTGRLALS